jgi:PAS domain S-box-containing protein
MPEKVLINYYVSLFNLAPLAYFVLDQHGQIVDVNAFGTELCGIPKSELLETEFRSLIKSQACQEKYQQHLNEAIDSGKREFLECQILHTNGSMLFVLIDTIRMNDDAGNLKYLLSAVTDISKEKKQAESLEMSLVKEKKLNELKSQFITVASHEFRTPLTTILTSAELMLKYTKDEEADKRLRHFRNISTSIHRLKEVLMDFMSAQKLELQKTANNCEYFNLKEFTEAVIQEVKTYNGIHHLEYVHVKSPEIVFLDKQLLKTCLTNLIINAYKYSPGGSVVKIKTNQNTSTNQILISVEDQGIGIPEEQQIHIFEPFFRANNVTNINGTGLGLNITKELAHLMGGAISFQSKEGAGSKFDLVFPIENV